MNQPQPERIVIATRESRLALWQAEHVRDRLRALYPRCSVELLGMTTRGDQILDRPLAKVGGKGLFVKELETALLDRRADIAVHSMKDVPMVMEPEFALVAISARENPLDALVSNKYASLDEIPPGGVVGTSSLRRESQLRARFPGLSVTSLRGNLDTRLRKLDEGQYDAVSRIAAVIGCAIYIKSEVLREVGLLDERFFIYHEEYDLCRRAENAGWYCYFVPDAKVWHKVSMSMGGEYSPSLYYLWTRNWMLLSRKHTPVLLWPMLYLAYLKESFWVYQGLGEKGRHAAAEAALAGAWHALLNRFGPPGGLVPPRFLSRVAARRFRRVSGCGG